MAFLFLVAASIASAADFGRSLHAIEAALRHPAPVRVAAHRASWAGAPENSRAGVRGAAAAGIPFVEIDLRLSRDGEVFAAHDPISGRTAQELARTPLANGESWPRFSDLYEAARGRTVLLLDIKEDVVERVADEVARSGSLRDVVFFVSDERALASAWRARVRHPGVRVMAKIAGVYDLERVQALFGGSLPEWVQNDLPSYELVQAAHARGALVCASVEGADRVPGFRRAAVEILRKRGVDLLLTDAPAWLSSLLSRE